MRTILLFLIFQCFVLTYSLASESIAIQVEKIHENSWRGSVNGIPVMVLLGDPEERAFAHGVLAADEILDLMNDYVIPQAGSTTRYKRFLKPLVSRMHWRSGWNEELDAMLAGIEQALPKADERKLKALKRPIQRHDLAIANALADWAPFACSSLSVWGESSEGGLLRTARNLDYPGNRALIDGICLIIHTSKAHDTGFLNLGWFGGLGAYTAMNHHGVFAAIHDVPVSPPNSMQEIADLAPEPRTLVIRDALLNAKRATDLRTGLDDVPVLMGNNLAVSDSQEAAVIAWSKHTKFAAKITKNTNRNHIACTNHHPHKTALAFPDSIKRYKSLDATSQKLDVAALQSKLHQVSRRTTVHSVIAEPATRRMFIALQQRVGQSATHARWVEITWNELTEHHISTKEIKQAK